MKKIPAIIAALVVSGLVAVAMLAVGVNALWNPAGVDQIPVTGSDAQTIAGLQARINEYQAREAQYQQQLEQARAQIEQANSDLATYQDLMNSFQQMGNLPFERDHDDDFDHVGRHDD